MTERVQQENVSANKTRRTAAKKGGKSAAATPSVASNMSIQGIKTELTNAGFVDEVWKLSAEKGNKAKFVALYFEKMRK